MVAQDDGGLYGSDGTVDTADERDLIAGILKDPVMMVAALVRLSPDAVLEDHDADAVWHAFVRMHSNGGGIDAQSAARHVHPGDVIAR